VPIQSAAIVGPHLVRSARILLGSSSHDAIVYDVLGGGTAWKFTKGSTETSVVADGRLRITAAEGAREAVLADLGLAIASQWMFAPELERGIVRYCRNGNCRRSPCGRSSRPDVA